LKPPITDRPDFSFEKTFTRGVHKVRKTFVKVSKQGNKTMAHRKKGPKAFHKKGGTGYFFTLGLRLSIYSCFFPQGFFLQRPWGKTMIRRNHGDTARAKGVPQKLNSRGGGRDAFAPVGGRRRAFVEIKEKKKNGVPGALVVQNCSKKIRVLRGEVAKS